MPQHARPQLCRSNVRIVFGNVVDADSHVDKLLVVCVADRTTDQRPARCAFSVVVDDSVCRERAVRLRAYVLIVCASR